MDPQVCIRNLIDFLYARSKGTPSERFFTVYSKTVVKNGKQVIELEYDLLQYQFLDTGKDNIMKHIYDIKQIKQAAATIEDHLTPSVAKIMKEALTKQAEDWINRLIIKYWPKRFVGDIHNFC